MAQISHWHILGAGSLGCLWAYYLSRAGHRVSVICRDAAQQQQLQQHLPLRITRQGETSSAEIELLTPASSGTIENLLICLKAYQTHETMQPLANHLNQDATLVLMQNGMGNQHWLASHFSKHSVYAAITTEAACRQGPLHSEHTGSGLTQLGLISGKADQHLPDKLHCGLTSCFNGDIEAALWQKLVINCCINPLTAIYQCHNGELANIPEARQQISAIISECRQVATALGKSAGLTDIEDRVYQVIEKTAANTSSMRQDVLHGQMTEIDFMNGFVVEQAKLLGLAVPANTRMVEKIHALTDKGV